MHLSATLLTQDCKVTSNQSMIHSHQLCFGIWSSLTDHLITHRSTV